MNIDVRNSLNNVRDILNAIETDTDKDYTKILVNDIFDFIAIISIKNSAERYQYFNTVYLNGEFKQNTQSTYKASDIPKLLKYNFGLEKSNEIIIKNLIVNFYINLGKSYTSGFDKKDIDFDIYISQINLMNGYVNSISEEEHKKNNHTLAKSANSDTNKQMNDKNEKHISDIPSEPEESLDDLLKKLNSLIGLNSVKQEVEQIINLVKVKKKGEELGEKTAPLSLHLVFFGNPGTGKTTVARLLAKIYKCLGVLSTGQLIEVDRGGLVGGYVGQTAIKTREVIDSAMGGILFIDEAYALTHGKGENDFGQEAVDTILKAMEDNRDDFIVIVAGYPDLMKEFIASNPGLKSRFNQYINFEDYTSDELYEIFLLQCSSNNLILADDCADFLKQHFSNLYNNRKSDYANGRDVRNYFEKVIKVRANRLAPILENISLEEYKTIKLGDLIRAAELKNTI